MLNNLFIPVRPIWVGIEPRMSVKAKFRLSYIPVICPNSLGMVPERCVFAPTVISIVTIVKYPYSVGMVDVRELRESMGPNVRAVIRPSSVGILPEKAFE